jgi:multiple sugar transport system permease protein
VVQAIVERTCLFTGPVKNPAQRNAKPYRRELRWFLLPYLIGTLAHGVRRCFRSSLTTPFAAGVSGLNFQDVAAERSWIACKTRCISSVPLRLLLALSLALLLNVRRRGAGVVSHRGLSAHDDSRCGLCADLVVDRQSVYGPLNLVLRSIGLPAPDWLTQHHQIALRHDVAAANRRSFVILLAGLHNQPRECMRRPPSTAHRAGSAYGMTLPLLQPWLIIVIVRDVILGFQYTFTPSLIMTGGDPYYATLFTPLLIYEEAFDRFRFGQGAVIMLITFVLTAYLLYTLFQLSKGWGYADET